MVYFPRKTGWNFERWGTLLWHWQRQWVHPSLATWPNSVGDHFGNQSKSEFSICCWAAYPNKQDESCIRFWNYLSTRCIFPLIFPLNFIVCHVKYIYWGYWLIIIIIFWHYVWKHCIFLLVFPTALMQLFDYEK